MSTHISGSIFNDENSSALATRQSLKLNANTSNNAPTTRKGLGNINVVKPNQQQQTQQPRRALGDITNKSKPANTINISNNQQKSTQQNKITQPIKINSVTKTNTTIKPTQSTNNSINIALDDDDNDNIELEFSAGRPGIENLVGESIENELGLTPDVLQSIIKQPIHQLAFAKFNRNELIEIEDSITFGEYKKQKQNNSNNNNNINNINQPSLLGQSEITADDLANLDLDLELDLEL